MVGSLAAVGAQATTISTAGFAANLVLPYLADGKLPADTARLADFGQINIDPASGGFAETGYLQFLGFTSGGQAVDLPGFNDPSGAGWGAYIQYRGTGSQVVTPGGIVATYTALTYSLFGFNGLATFGLNPATGAADESGGSNLTLLGDGSLINGPITLIPTAFSGGVPAQFAVSGDIKATLTDLPGQAASESLLGIDINVVHPPGEVFPISATTFEANGGSSSSLTLTNGQGTPVPEPSSFLLLVAGLLATVYRRRRRLDQSLANSSVARGALDTRRR